MVCAEGIILSVDANMLACNGGHILITKTWAKSLLQRMGFVKRKATTKAKVSIENFEELKVQFLIDIKTIVTLEEIPLEPIINWDQTAMHYVPVSSWTMEVKGAKRVEITGIDDKRQITAVFAYSMDFPMQLVYQGKTEKCHLTFQFPCDWHITHSPNHWCNEGTMKDYIRKMLVPYVDAKRQELKLRCDQRALVIYDKFKAQCTQDIFDMLQKNNIDIVTIPANCTDRLQPLDISVNKAAKSFMRGQFQTWYSKQISLQMKIGGANDPVDLCLSVVMSVSSQWFVNLYDYLLSKPDIIKNGFKGAGITADSLYA